MLSVQELLDNPALGRHTELSLARPLLEQRGLFGDLLMLAISTANQAAMADLYA